ncbi:uncharacterized protein F5891DRAFT_1058202 [Suillus fuscotomentosus]|uniref:Uncharacterized protein n=1 Tax=Suillus fuscotomentosus TaxID=1912939 RepID=A0AAD4DXK0_9AGAM|nr:uncharacterized protein F5891DRAFT_1058202 [Suillus fuscotomentosus]KAG1895411.1 hypothetical protein F5891DRAFT_1058202 [Suillus fuscotomentosus]
MDSAPTDSTHLDWGNVGLGFSFIIFNALISTSLQLGVGSSLLSAAIRCVVQLGLVAMVLQKVFETNNPWAVGGIACLMNLLGTVEAVINKSKKRYNHMFSCVLFGMLCSTIPVSIIGIRFAMVIEPFWKPEQYIPIVGMLCGGTVSGIVVAVSYVLREIYDNRDKVEMYLAFGASRFEACRPVAREALRLALAPTISQMSVIGIISIPGMMTGAILGGSSVQQAARLQMVIMFMISASTALATIITTVTTLAIVVDNEDRLRPDRVDVRDHPVWRARNWLFSRAVDGVKHTVRSCRGLARKDRQNGVAETDRLLG